MPLAEWENKRTKKRVGILKHRYKLIHVQYESGMKAWFKSEDFYRIFKKI